jgi:2-oxoglutarate ferredoxin oxidoreductase subunit alpha
MMRGGPGLGNIAPSQADYLQAVKGGGHGDYHLIVLAPHTVQEIVDLTYKAFDLAFKYRNCVMILADGALGQMSEPVVMPPMKDSAPKTDWSLLSGGERVIIRSMRLNPEDELERLNHFLQAKYEQIKKDYVEYESYKTDDADYLFVAYGTPARVCRSVVDDLREEGIKIGLFRPVSLWPFPEKELSALAQKMSARSKPMIITVEMAHNQLEQDVRLAVNGKVKVTGLNKLGGALFTEEGLLNDTKNLLKE